MSLRGRGGGVCKPSLDDHSSMAAPVEGEPPPEMFVNLPLLGFRYVVAPINKASCAQGPHLSNTSLSGDVQKLPGPVDAASKVAPSLCFVIRKMLESQQMSPESIKNYLVKATSLPRYDGAFRQLWAWLQTSNIDPWRASTMEIASAIIKMHSISKAQARNAYSAVLLLPGYGNVRFLPILAPFKREWNLNVEKYATFWNPESIIQCMAATA